MNLNGIFFKDLGDRGARLTSQSKSHPAVCSASPSKDLSVEKKVRTDNVGGQGVKLLSSSVLNERKKTYLRQKKEAHSNSAALLGQREPSLR